MAEPEINAFLTHLAVKEKVSRHVLGHIIGDLGEVIRARRPKMSW